MIHCLPNSFHALDKEDIGWKILRLEILLAEDPAEVKHAASFFDLALLHAHYNNPNPDYARSLLMFDRYLSISSRSGRSDEARYVRSLLQKMAGMEEELARLRTDSDRERADRRAEAEALQRLNARLIKENEELTVEKKNLTEAIEQLKLLEQSLEKKRLGH
ncbi:MAG TPA: hypothetical protein ENN06_08945 [Desulfobacteraceae bacterium]|nr:hypothetical protein [Desulfobacteraceae bacterium]